jgi:hypothetical protein
MYPVMYPGEGMMFYCPYMYRALPEREEDDYESTEDDADVKEYKFMREEDDIEQDGHEDATLSQLSPAAGFRCARGEQVEEDEMETAPPGMQQPGTTPTGAGQPGMPGMQPMDPQQLINMIESHHPEIMQAMTQGQLSPQAARNIIRRIIQMCYMHCQ